MNNINNINVTSEFSSSIFAIKLILLLALILSFMDALQIYFTFSSFSSYSTLPSNIFNTCIKYQSIAETIFALYGTYAGLSLAILCFGLITNYDFFIGKGLRAYIYYNYCIFGPYLLCVSFMGFSYYDKIAYVCDDKDYKVRYLNITLVFCLLFSFVMSIFVTVSYMVINVNNLFMNSIRFNPGGSLLLGYAFWKYAIRRGTNNVNENINEQMNISDFLNQSESTSIVNTYLNMFEI